MSDISPRPFFLSIVYFVVQGTNDLHAGHRPMMGPRHHPRVVAHDRNHQLSKFLLKGSLVIRARLASVVFHDLVDEGYSLRVQAAVRLERKRSDGNALVNGNVVVLFVLDGNSIVGGCPCVGLVLRQVRLISRIFSSAIPEPG